MGTILDSPLHYVNSTPILERTGLHFYQLLHAHFQPFKKLPFTLWAYRISFRTSTGITSYSLVYGMEAILLVEIVIGSLRVALEQQISKAEWTQSHYD